MRFLIITTIIALSSSCLSVNGIQIPGHCSLEGDNVLALKTRSYSARYTNPLIFAYCDEHICVPHNTWYVHSASVVKTYSGNADFDQIDVSIRDNEIELDEDEIWFASIEDIGDPKLEMDIGANYRVIDYCTR